MPRQFAKSLLVGTLILMFFSGAAAVLAADSGDGRPIIIDHTCTDLGQVPAEWIEAAK